MILLILIALLLNPITVWAASCDGSLSNCQTVMDGLSSGDTLNIPSGAFSWGAGLTMVPGVTVLGAGIDVTTINLASPYAFSVTYSTTAANTRISGMTINRQWESSNQKNITMDSLSYDGALPGRWRIDHIKFTGIQNYSDITIWLEGITYGLIDNCEWVGSSGTNIRVYGYTNNDAVRGDKAASLSLNPGSDEAVYIEDTTHTCTNDASGCFIVDALYGSKVVVRYSSITDGRLFHVHHNCVTNDHAPVWYEVYENEASDTAPLFNGAPVYFRGGTGVFWNNTISGYTEQDPDNAILLEEERISGGGCASLCDGDQTGFDGNYGDTNAPGWPCGDQIGWTGPRDGTQTNQPFYIWNNTGGVIALSNGNYFKSVAGDHTVTQDVDYCEHSPATTCGTKAGWTYTPYGDYIDGRYYHPLRELGDYTPPVLSALAPYGGIQPCLAARTVTLSLTTNENATCKFGTVFNQAYADMGTTFGTTGTTSHSHTYSVTCGQTYDLWVRCSDGTNPTTTSKEIWFTVDSRVPIGGGTIPIGGGTIQLGGN